MNNILLYHRLEWLHLKKEYLNLQKESMKNLKQSLKQMKMEDSSEQNKGTWNHMFLFSVWIWTCMREKIRRSRIYPAVVQ